MSELPARPGAHGLGLDQPAVSAVLSRLYAAARAGDPSAMARAHAEAAELPAPPTVAETSALCAAASLPVHPHTGRFLYTLVRTLRPRTVVEFGTSFGTSAVQLAAALRDNGAGHLTGTELEAGKVHQARANLAEAGLAEWATVLAGDARQTLATMARPVDLVLLDGWKELYLPVLEVLEPMLRPGSVIVSDNLPMLPDGFLTRIRDLGRGYSSVELPLGDGIELTTWTGEEW
ncbi:class I SAM-dependent methyltransferase [Kitasatospora sp. NBC_01287]|uniref:O-methyltransferase n=1 Tax=Kitasatospora sp. NBC_01287 TaxID=2903573 RepID=UPI002254EBEA|nr:class I SAM-dependent methyltransferase [Kitasatospora sp. NBC_01287]MCX4745630.1 class I SAM-dependent methyltransferase [Kitasatospora sp. NBC_01287]